MVTLSQRVAGHGSGSEINVSPQAVEPSAGVSVSPLHQRLNPFGHTALGKK